MPNLTVELQAILAVANNLVSPPPYIVNYDFGNPSMNANVGLYEPFFQALAGGVAVALPAATVFGIFVQNLDPTALLDVSFTPTGQASTTSRIGPGGVIFLYDPAKTGTGWTALTLKGVSATVPAMVFVGA